MKEKTLKIDGVDIDDIEFLKDQIKIQFGSMQQFAAETDVAYRPLLDFFNNLEVTKEKYELYKSKFYSEKKDRSFQYGRILDSDRESIRVCIMTNFKSYTDFCKKHKGFNVVYISNIVNGKLSLVSSKYRKLLRILEINYKLKLNSKDEKTNGGSDFTRGPSKRDK